jgi:uncharacterized protein YjbJ (UPF0337 family)
MGWLKTSQRGSQVDWPKKETIHEAKHYGQARGEFHELKGKVKEKVGRATNNPNLEAEGQREKIGGKVQRKIGQAEKVLGK